MFRSEGHERSTDTTGKAAVHSRARGLITSTEYPPASMRSLSSELSECWPTRLRGIDIALCLQYRLPLFLTAEFSL